MTVFAFSFYFPSYKRGLCRKGSNLQFTSANIHHGFWEMHAWLHAVQCQTLRDALREWAHVSRLTLSSSRELLGTPHLSGQFSSWCGLLNHTSWSRSIKDSCRGALREEGSQKHVSAHVNQSQMHTWRHQEGKIGRDGWARRGTGFWRAHSSHAGPYTMTSTSCYSSATPAILLSIKLKVFSWKAGNVHEMSWSATEGARLVAGSEIYVSLCSIWAHLPLSDMLQSWWIFQVTIWMRNLTHPE